MTTTDIVTTNQTAILALRTEGPLQPQPLDQQPAAVYLAGLSAGSRRTMTAALDTIAAELMGVDLAEYEHNRKLHGGPRLCQVMDWGSLRFQHTQAIRTLLAERYGFRTANKMLSALRGTLKAAWRLGQMTTDDYMRAADIASVTGETPSQAEVGRHISLGEFMAMVAAATDGSLAGVRDAAMLGIGYSALLRRSEIAALDLADFDQEKRTLTVRASKRNKTRTVPIANGASAALFDWLHVRGAAPGAIFLAIRKGDRVTDHGMTPQAVYNAMERMAERAGVASFTPHDLRRSGIGDMLDNGVDISTVQKIAGHANPATTSGYDRRGERAKVQAAGKLHFPYQAQFGG